MLGDVGTWNSEEELRTFNMKLGHNSELSSAFIHKRRAKCKRRWLARLGRAFKS